MPKTLNAINDPTPIRPLQPTLDELLNERVQAATNGVIEWTQKYVDQRIDQIVSDPLAFVRQWPSLLTVGNAAELLQLHVETVRSYTRLPQDHPDHLPRVTDSPIRILPADLAGWIERHRAS